MVRARRGWRPRACGLFGKLESFNPGGSVKDRIGVAMIEAAEAEGRIEPGRTTIVEATSGNTGIALAFVCAAKGYDLVLTLPQGMSREREGAAAPVRRARGDHRVAGRDERGGRRRARDGDARRRLPARPVLQPGQPRDPPAHDRPGDLGRARRRGRRPRRGVGTGGTITGAGEVLKERNPDLQVVAVEPATLGRALRPRARAAQDPGHRRRLRAAGAQPRRSSTRSSRSPTRTRSRPRALCARDARACSSGISCGAALWARDRGRAAAGVAGQADRRRAAGLRRALRLDAVLRAVEPSPSSAHRLGDARLSDAGARGRRGPPRRRRRARARPRRARRVDARRSSSSWPGVQALLAHRVAHALHEAGRPGRRRARCRWSSRTLTGIEIHPAAQIGHGLLHRPRHGRRHRRDRRDRRRRDALPGRDARRHRLRDRQAPPDGARTT